MLTLLVIVAIVAAAFVAYKITKKENSSVETKVEVAAPEKIEPIETKKESPAKKPQAKKTTVKKQK
jgi:hypothetical protein